MSTSLNIHPIQANILLVLLHRPSARFSQMNPMKIPSDQFNFHVKKLISEKLIGKNIRWDYELTDLGKEFANRFDTEKKLLKGKQKLLF